MKNIKLVMSLLAIFLSCFALQALAQASPMMTVLQPQRHTQTIPDGDVSAMLHGFTACNPQAALPSAILAPLGVKFLGKIQAAGVRFSLPDPLKEHDVLLLAGNDPANMDRATDGSFSIYGGKYRLKKRLALADSIKLTGVGEMMAVNEKRARVGVTYTLNVSAALFLAFVEEGQQIDLKSRIDRMPKSGKATAEDVWFTLGPDGRSATCWRFVD